MDDVLTLNHVQVAGTHNSYHVTPDPLIVLEWGYTHSSLEAQARDQGVRQFELDVHYSADLADFEVYHVDIFDRESNCALLSDCLASLRAWSDDNPAHLPVVVMIEPKDDTGGEDLSVRYDELDEAILAGWPRERMLTPDDLRGDADTLREVVTTTGWPTLGELRGSALFYMLDGGVHRDGYIAAAGLDGRVMFARTDHDDDLASILMMDDPTDADIAERVADGFLVRTRADAGSEEAWAADTSRQEAALASGAQLISTDYPVAVDGVDYVLEIPGGMPARCDPVTAPVECTAEAVEDPAFMR